MGLTRLAITRPLAVLMFIVSMVLMGGVAFTRLKVDRFPNISFPAVFVSVAYPGAAPVDVEELVAKPLENTVAGLAGIESITSTSSEGFASLNIRFVEGTDTNQAALDVERRIAAVRGRLPDEIDAPTVTKADIQALPVMNIRMSGQRSLIDLYSLAEDTVLPRLQSVAGVADVTISGGLQREIQVKVDPERLRGFNITLQTVQTALTRENVSTPSGRLSEGASTVSVRSSSQFRTLDDLRNLQVQTSPTAVRLQDVATVQDTFAEQTRIQRFNGQDAVGFSITKQADANGVAVADAIKAAVAQVQPTLPRDITMTITSDSSVFTRRSLQAVINDLQIGVVLTGIVLLIFLHTWRNTFIVLLAIPTCLISTFLVIYFAGFSLNIISLMALALTIGILVDDSIVVLENINRHLEMGEPPREAALAGRSEIGLAAIAITLVDVIVFLPVSFMSGNIGRLFKEFGITIAACTLFSLFVSFTLTPMLASRWLSHREGRGRGLLAAFGRVWDHGYDILAAGYRGLLRVGLRARWLVVLIAFGTLGGASSLLYYNLIGSEYAPPEDDGLFTVSVTMPTGTSLAGTDAAVRRVEQMLAAIPEVEAVFATVGSGGGFGGGSSSTRSANISVQLVEKSHRDRSVFDIVRDVNRTLPRFPDAQLRANPPNNPLAGGGGGGSLQIRLLGDDFTRLTQLAAEVEEAARNTPGTAAVQNDAQQRDPEVRAVINRERIADARVSAEQVGSTLRTMIGGTVVTQLRPDGAEQVDIRLIGADGQRASPAQLGAIPLQGAAGNTVRLDQVATLVNDAGPARIQRTDRQRVITVTANVAGRSLGDVTRDVRALTNQIALPEGYRLMYAGQVQQQETAFATLLQALGLSVVLVYMLMVALYESWLTPLAIMFSLPVALVGAFLGLYLTGNTFNIFSMIGMIMLMGLVGKNGILLIDFTDMLRRRGLGRTEALLEAGYTRLRPIVMTTATVVFAMLPLALKLEEGGESRAPLAVVLIGGVLSSTLLTLFLVPSVYSILDDAKNLVEGIGRRLTGRQPAPVPAHAAATAAPSPAAPSHGAPSHAAPAALPRVAPPAAPPRVLPSPPPIRGASED